MTVSEFCHAGKGTKVIIESKVWGVKGPQGREDVGMSGNLPWERPSSASHPVLATLGL